MYTSWEQPEVGIAQEGKRVVNTNMWVEARRTVMAGTVVEVVAHSGSSRVVQGHAISRIYHTLFGKELVKGTKIFLLHGDPALVCQQTLTTTGQFMLGNGGK